MKLVLQSPPHFPPPLHDPDTTMSMTRQEQIDSLQREWTENPRWKDITRGYGAEDEVRLRG